MVRKVIGWFCIFVAVCSLIVTICIWKGDNAIAGVIGIVFYGAIGGFLLMRVRKNPKEMERKKLKAEKEAEKERQREFEQRSFLGAHMAGLPLAPEAGCVLSFEEDHIAINSSGNIFKVGFDKIIDMCMDTDVTIQKYYVSSAGGAVAGAALFGPLGAMAGGRTKEKVSRDFTYYAVITYNKDDEIRYITCRVSEYRKIPKLIEKYKPQFTGKTITVDL